MFSNWYERSAYVCFAALALLMTAIWTRPGLEAALHEPIKPGFGPPCTLWQAWKLFCSFIWERVLLGGTIIAISIRLVLGDWKPVDVLIVSAIVIAFPFQEYFTHKYLLHRPTRNFLGQRAESVAALVHRVHHRNPWCMQRAINPPIAVVFYAVGLPILFFPFLAPPQAMTGIAASWIVLLAYEWIHLLIHTSHVPRNRLYKRIWRNHRLHHFKNEHYWFNVSTIGVDAILGTQPELAEVPTSKTCLSLDQSREAASNGPEIDGSALHHGRDYFRRRSR
jgi:hypothetical protein